MDKIVEWPAWRYGPGGKSDVFKSADDVPEGWADHPSKVDENFDPNAGAATDPHDAMPPVVAPKANDTTLDSDGWPWDAARNSADQEKNAAGQWKLKPGQRRPEPKEGYPKAALDL